MERIGDIGLQEKRREVLESIPKKYTRDVRTNVWQRPEYRGIAYSDGNVIEHRLTRIVNNVGDGIPMASSRFWPINRIADASDF